MNSPNTSKINALQHPYREGAWPEPTRQIQQAILETDHGWYAFARRWALPLALAAAMLTFAFVLWSVQHKPPVIADPAPGASPAQLKQPAAAPADKAKAPAEAKSAPAPAQPARSETATPSYAMRMDEAERRGLLHKEIGLKPGMSASESPLPPPAPKATAKAPEAARAPTPPTLVPTRTPQGWIEEIRKLRAEAKAEDAARELAEFRKRYADYLLPEDLR